MKTKKINNLLTTNNFIKKYYLNNVLSKLKVLLKLLFELNIIKGKVYFIGFPDFTVSNFSILFKRFNSINLKSEIWVNGLLSNSVYMSRYLSYNRVKSKLKKKKIIFIKEFKDLFNRYSIPSLLIFYKNQPEIQPIIIECQKLKVPVVIIFDKPITVTNTTYDSNIITIFNYNLLYKKELFIHFFYKLLESLLKKNNLFNKINKDEDN